MYQYKETIDSVPRKPTNPGDAFLNTYVETTKRGTKSIEYSGKTNIYEYVQQDLEMSKIENIMARVAKGDLEALRKAEPQYIDTTTMPSSMMEVQNLIVRSKEEFEKFPGEIKRLFNYSPEQYINEMGTPEYLEKMKPFNEKIAKIAAEKNAAEYERKVKEGAKLNYDIAREVKAMGGTEE